MQSAIIKKINVLFVIILLLLPVMSRADEFVESEYYGGSNYNISTLGRPHSQMPFTASGNPVSRVSLMIWKGGDGFNIDVKLCADPSCTTILWNDNIADSQVSSVVQSSVSLDISPAVSLTPSLTYYIDTRTTGTQTQVNSRGQGLADPGVMNYSIYYSINNDLERNINYDYGLADTYPDFNTVNSQTCIIGLDCNLWYSFNELAIGNTVYLIEYEDITTPDNAIASEVIEYTSMWQNKILVPAVSTSTEKKYNLLLTDPVYGWNTKTGITIKWVDGDYWNEILIEKYGEIEVFCDTEEICEDVATSSDFLYGVQCGFRQTLCWMFAPTAGSKKYILNAVKGMEESAPFNLYFGLVNRLGTAVSSVSTTSAVSLGVPFIDHNGEFYILPVVTTSTMPNALGDSYGTVKTGLEYFVWVITSFFITLIIWKIAL